MSIDRISKYRPPLMLRNQHLATIYPALFRRVEAISYVRERIETPDGDFLDLDWSRTGSDTLLIAVHGLEGDANSQYIRGLVLAANGKKWDALALNLRNCSGEANRLYTSYHSGRSDDVALLIEHIKTTFQYKNIVLVGFSLGGNISLKFAGEQSDQLKGRVQALAAVSVPTNLKASALHLHRISNRLYLKRFLKSLRQKATEKLHLFPEQATFSLNDLRQARNFTDYDNLYTAPAHGFRDADDYWTRCSSGPLIPSIRIPTLIINAQDDPFLPTECYPHEEAAANPLVQLEVPRYGGHVGFATNSRLKGPFWQEMRIVEFFEGVLKGTIPA
jgi:hypothetical protein